MLLLWRPYICIDKTALIFIQDSGLATAEDPNKPFAVHKMALSLNKFYSNKIRKIPLSTTKFRNSVIRGATEGRRWGARAPSCIS